MRKNGNWIRLLSFSLCFCMVIGLFSGFAPMVTHGAGTEGMITIDMADRYSDGWTGNAIEIYVDGILLDTATIETGKTGVWSVEYNPHASYRFCWVGGRFASETSFIIYLGAQTMVNASGSLYSDGAEILALAASCAEASYVDGVCANCGTACDHTIDCDGMCSICGFFVQDITGPTESVPFAAVLVCMRRF